tara:strand:- start:1119 stop:2171 length:1053 start_codon:yes stop_codon:yes gene_type:complete
MKSKNFPENIIKVFKKDGFVLSEPDILLDSDYIIQRSGENFRKLMLTFEDDTGKNMCLRPDLTVASCIKYLKDNSKKTSRIFYSGQAYRRSSNSKEKVINDQLGIEVLGSKNKYTDDLKVLKTIVTSIEKIKIKNTTIKVGDVSLFQKLIESLKIPERWKVRLKRHFWRPEYFEDLLKRLETNSDVDPIAIDLDKKKFSEMKNLDQNKEIAGRKISEILSRFDRKIKDPRSFAENKKVVKIIREFLKINCSVEKLEKILKSFIKKNNLNNNILKDLSKIKNLSKINSKTIFSTNFGRDIEYYTGIVFEIYNSSKKEIARGGRYDSLLKSLGSKKDVSAVGAAINLNNLKV